MADRALPITDAPASGTFRRQSFGAVGSTNDLAFEAAAKGDAGNLWLVAERQTKGRGRQGRQWVSEPGNLYASLLLPAIADIAVIPQLPLVAAIALADALERVCGPQLSGRIAIKWPNDLLLDGQKIAGILAESRLVGAVQAVVIGIGVNCAHGPELANYPATSLAAAGAPVAPDELFAELSKAMATRLGEWGDGQGFGQTRAAWLSRAAGIGQPITVKLPGKTVTGRFSGIDKEGRLVLNGAAGKTGGETIISAGDVFFPDMVWSGGKL